MADEIKIRIVGTVSDSDLPGEPPIDTTCNYDMATPVIERGVQIVGTAAHEAIRLGDVATPGPMVLVNLSAANFVTLGLDDAGSFVPFDQIEPGEARVVKPPSGVTLYAKADTNPVNLNRFIPSV